MSNTIYIVLIIAVIVVIGLVLNGKMSKRKTLVFYSVSRKDSSNYNAYLGKANPEVEQVEYIRLAVYFIAKMLYNIGSSRNYTINEVLESIKILSSKSDVLQFKDVLSSRVRVHNVDHPQKGVSATLYRGKGIHRMIQTSILFNNDELLLSNSIYVLLHLVADNLDESHYKLFLRNLQHLSIAYSNMGFDPTSMSSLIRLPSEVYLASVTPIKLI